MGLDQYLSARRKYDRDAGGVGTYHDLREIFGEFSADCDVTFYISDYDFYSDSKREKFRKVTELVGLRDYLDKTTPSGDVTFDSDYAWVTVETVVAYWRKANQVHGWFVRECQDGIDECQATVVPREKLVQLRDACENLLSVPAGVDASRRAQQDLPPTGGFFFGSYDIDAWYWQDIRDTAEGLTRALKVPEEFELVYRASW